MVSPTPNAAETATEVISRAIYKENPGTLYNLYAERAVAALAAAGFAVVQLPEPQWQNSTGTSWQVDLDGEIEDVYRRGDDITVSGIETFAADDVPALAAALLAAVSSLPTTTEEQP